MKKYSLFLLANIAFFLISSALVYINYLNSYIGSLELILLGILVFMNMLFVILNNQKYYLNTVIDKASFVTVCLIFLALEFEMSYRTFILIALVHNLILILHYAFLHISKKMKYILKVDSQEVEALEATLEEKQLKLKIKEKYTFDRKYYFIDISKDEEDGLIKLLSKNIKPREQRYTIVNLIVLLILVAVLVSTYLRMRG